MPVDGEVESGKMFPDTGLTLFSVGISPELGRKKMPTE
jgi:hypothetical protein